MRKLGVREAFCYLGLLLALGGCAQLSGDGGQDGVRRLLQERGGPAMPSAAAHAQQVGALLAQPLTADSAVQVALLNNHGLQASYGELGLAEADLVQAGRSAFARPPIPSAGSAFRVRPGAPGARACCRALQLPPSSMRRARSAPASAARCRP